MFVTGSTGYIGRRLIPVLCGRGNEVVALARAESRHKISGECGIVIGNVLEGDSYGDSVCGADTFIHLAGVPHPSPAKARAFVEIDLRSGLEAVRIAREKGIEHFIYVSVAHPAPTMKEYIEVRTSCEDTIRESGLKATIVRPWYVLGPGHRWPYALIPFCALAEMIPATREGARRLGLVTINEMVNTLANAVANPGQSVCIIEAPEIRRIGRASI